MNTHTRTHIGRESNKTQSTERQDAESTIAAGLRRLRRNATHVLKTSRAMYTELMVEAIGTLCNGVCFKRRTTRRVRWSVVIGQCHGNCTTSSICVLFSTLALMRRAPQTPCIKSPLFSGWCHAQISALEVLFQRCCSNLPEGSFTYKLNSSCGVRLSRSPESGVATTRLPPHCSTLPISIIVHMASD